jgi:hypothetical protein
MKGIIFNITEKFINDTYGEDTFDEILVECQLITKEPFVDPGTYPDEDLLEIVGKSCAHLNERLPDFLKKLGKYAFFQLASAYPGFVKGFNHPKDFLKTVDSIIHVEIRKLYRDAYLPEFVYHDPDPLTLVISYYSKRRLYDLMEGLIEGVGEYFNHPISQQRKLRTAGEREVCDYHLTF